MGEPVGTGVSVSLGKGSETYCHTLDLLRGSSHAFLCLFMFYYVILFLCSASLSRSLSGSVLQLAVLFP